MSPIGLITALAAGIALLWEDYQTWKEGGDSLIDWGKWKPEVDAALKMVRDLKTTVNDLAKALAKLLNIDPKSWSLKWDFSNFIDQMGEFSKMLNMIADLLNAIKDGRWADAASIGKQMLNQGSENPSAMPMVTDSANSVAEWIKDKTGWDPRSVGQTIRSIGEDEPEQHAQAAKRGERNNNPGNLNFAGQAGAELERPGGRFARFETAFDGLRALSRQLVLYAGRGINSVEKIISTWAPASDNNNTAAYIQAVSQRLGVNPQAALNINDPQTMSALMSSIIHHENGRNIYSKELIGKAAVAGIGGANVNQQNTYHIYGGGDRVHDLSDAFCIVGPQSQAQKISGISTGAAQLRSDDGSTFFELNPTTQKIKIVAPGGLDVVTPQADFSAKVTIHGLLSWLGGMVGSVASGVASKITGAVEFIGTVKANGKSIDDTHTHGGVQHGTSNTGGVN